MRKRLQGIITLFIILLGFTSYAQESDLREEWVDSVFKSLSLEERIAQLMVVRANDPGKDYYSSIEKYITKYNIGGVCFFRNHPHHQAITTNIWQQKAKTPLLVSIDAEWGLGMRLDSTTVFPFQMTLGAIQDNELIYRMGAEIADQCKRIGVQMNFAPVVDINSNADNPVIGMRSFGQDKENVMQKGMAYMNGLQDNGVIATAKHFPGHGDTDTDSHKTLPVIAHSVERLDSVELYPFKELIANGLGGIMIAHLYIPEYEKEEGLASTLSPAIVDDLLRKKLGFDGLIVTDALDMKGVTKYHKPGDIEVKALLAGNDILLLPADVPKAIRQVKRAITNGELNESVVDERCRKVLGYKFDSGLAHDSGVKIESLYEDLNNPHASALNRQLYESSATLLRNENDILPLRSLDTLNIAYISVGGSLKDDNFASRLGLYGRMKTYELTDKDDKKDADKLFEKLLDHNLLIIGLRNTNIYSYRNYGISEQSWTFIRKLINAKPAILDLFASPYALENLYPDQLPEALIVSYQNNKLSEQVGAEIIFGGLGAEGILPVSVGNMFPSGSGLTTTAARLGFTDPELLGISAEYIETADSIILSGIDLKAYPGCQVLAAKDGRIFYHKAFGYHTYDNKRKVLESDLYDLASLTKIAATTFSVMDLYGQGLIDIDERLSTYLPFLLYTDKKDIVIRELLAHQSRFQAWIPYYRYTIGDDAPETEIYAREISEDHPVRVAEGMYIQQDYFREIMDSICFSSLRVSNHYKYSDLGFYLMKEAMEAILNRSYNHFVEEQYYNPLGLPTMGYLPLQRFAREKITPTENDKVFRKQLLHGDVHDQGAAMLGGVSGHAGLFSNAFDMAVIMQTYLDGGTYGGDRYLQENIVREFTKTQFPLNENRRGIGFDKPMLVYVDDGPTCRSASSQSFGHSGFTGTYAWADPKNGLVYIFLSNRVHPNASNAKIMEYDIRTNLHQVFYDALEQEVQKNENPE